VNILEFLSQNTLTQNLVYLFVSFLLIVVVLVITKPHFEFGKIKICFADLANRRKKFAHKDCQNNSDLIVLEEYRKVRYKKMYFIEAHELMATSIKRLDTALVRAKTMLLDCYRDLMRDKVYESELISHRNFMDYASLIEHLIFLYVKDLFREILLDQSVIPESSSPLFNGYIHDLTENTVDKAGSYVDLWYIDIGRQISREALKQANLKMIPDIENLVRDFFYGLKEINVSYGVQVERLKSEIRGKEIELLGFTTM
jgi:hypothetical protein